MSNTYNDLIGTVYPDNIDSFENKVDLSIETQPLAVQYKNLLASGNFSGAQSILENNPELAKAVITANDINALQDAIIAVQRFFKREKQQVIFSVEEPTGENIQSVGDIWVKILEDGTGEMYELTEDGYVLRIFSSNETIEARLQVVEEKVTEAQAAADDSLMRWSGCSISFTDENGNVTDEPYIHWYIDDETGKVVDEVPQAEDGEF